MIEYLLAKIGLDTAENEPLEVWGKIQFIIHLTPRSQCALKKKEWAERCAMRAEEIAAVSQAIKILNDDDALDLFKKTLSLAQSSSLRFLQTSASQA